MSGHLLFASRELAEAFITSLEQNPVRWTRCRYRLEHESGVSLWTGHELHIWAPREIRFRFMDRRRVAKAIRSWVRANPTATTDHGHDIIALLRGPA